MIQYMIWKNCKHDCSFCTLSDKQFDEYKVKNLQTVYELLDKDEVKQFRKIAFIGGEIFHYINESPEVKEWTYKCFEKAFSYIDNPEYKTIRIMIMTNLFYDFEPLQEFIDFAGKHKDKIVICTSYDVYGRFNSPNDKENFDRNFQKLKDLGITVHVETILSVNLLKQVINGEFSVKDFMEKYTDNMDFITPYKDHPLVIKDEDFFPPRKLFLQFLKKMFLELKHYPAERFMLKINHSNIVYRFHRGEYIVEYERRTSNKYLPYDKHNYIDSDITMLHDWEEFKKVSGIL